jgi:hypothetical protein
VAHLVPDAVLKPGYEGKPVLTERQEELRTHTIEDVGFALRLLAYNNTRYSVTSRILEEDYGIKVHPTTLRQWVTSHFTQKYVEIQHELEKNINEKLSAEIIDLAATATEAQAKALERGLDTINELKPGEVASAVKNYASTAGTNIEQANLLRDKPTTIVKHQTPDDAIKFLREKGLLVDSTAEEIED